MIARKIAAADLENIKNIAKKNDKGARGPSDYNIMRASAGSDGDFPHQFSSMEQFTGAFGLLVAICIVGIANEFL